ncbi:MAG: hypothetical protein HDR11_08390 [Lachnospiraceae bacterium]|nr:hypothetical protein [Lachnospiraceae bacterium]MBD5512562.1 hypothetical protein [Lachnospiraceae bacterium]
MKKMVALLATVMILAGSVGMTASAATPDTCSHPYLRNEKVDDYIETYTHSVRVNSSTNGKPAYALCLAEIRWQRYRDVCSQCHKEIGSYLTKVYEVHSMH